MAVRLVRRVGWREEGGQLLTTPSISLIHLRRRGGGGGGGCNIGSECVP